MATIKCFEDLEIWKLARLICKKTYFIINVLRAKKEFRLADQMKSSSGSIMDNIAEGFERNSRFEFVNSLGTSKGENGELKSQLYRCLDCEDITQSQFDDLASDIEILSRKISSFIQYLNNTEMKGLKFKNRNAKNLNHKP
jgi:four helix bundle protein